MTSSFANTLDGSLPYGQHNLNSNCRPFSRFNPCHKNFNNVYQSSIGVINTVADSAIAGLELFQTVIPRQVALPTGTTNASAIELASGELVLTSGGVNVTYSIGANVELREYFNSLSTYNVVEGFTYYLQIFNKDAGDVAINNIPIRGGTTTAVTLTQDTSVLFKVVLQGNSYIFERLN